MANEPSNRALHSADLGRELEALMGDQLARIRRRFLLHGAGWLLGAMSVGALIYFALDHTLRLPGMVRLVLTGGAVALLAWGMRRQILYPFQRAFSRDDAALAVERVFPELQQKLISAIQLRQMLGAEDSALRNQSQEMIERLVAEATAASRSLPLERVLDSTSTARLWGLSATVSMLLLVGAALQPDVTAAFLQRVLGMNVSYPRATTLIVELPPDGPEVRRNDSGDTVELTLAAGSDLHVNVRAEGAVPREVFLEVDSASGERTVAMTSRTGGRFRHVFRRIQNGFSFHARGGDDDSGDKTVHVRTINPPLVGEIRATLTPPDYTRQAAAEQVGGNLEALVGTQVVLQVTATAGVRTAVMEFLESGQELELLPVTIEDDSGRSQVYRGNFTVTDSDRYRIQLVGDTGLSNPHPGTYPIAALEDFVPWGRMLNPDDENLDFLLPTGVVAVRIEARDDYGLTSAGLHIEIGESKSDLSLWQDSGEGQPTLRRIFTELLEVKDLIGGTRAGQEGLLLTGELQDNRTPEPLVTTLPRRQVQIVDEGQLAAAISRQFRAIREDVDRAVDLQRDRLDRLQDIRDQVAGGAQLAAVTAALTGIEVGQGRIQSIADRVHRQLMRAFDLHLFNRLDPAAPAEEVLQLYGQWHRENPEGQSFVPGFYREVLSLRRSGRLAAMETILDPILAMLAIADMLAADLTPKAVRQIARAQVDQDGGRMLETLQEAVPLQERILTEWQSLLERLDEWNDFQDVIQEARALRDRQRDVQNRTDEFRGKR